MKTKNKLRTGAEIVLIVAFMLSLGVNIADTDEGYLPYSCAKENVDDMMCYKLSRPSKIDDVQRYCYYDRDKPKSFKRCDLGWERLINIDEYEQDCDPLILAYTDDGKYICEGIGEDQQCKRTDEILSSLG